MRLGNDKWFLFCSGINNIVVKIDNSWYINESLRDFWRGCVNLHTPGSHQSSLNKRFDSLTDKARQ